MAILSVSDLKTYFHTRNGVVKAVDGVSFDVQEGEMLGVVGESGSGKSVTGYSLLGLIPTPPGRIESGSALFEGVDLLNCAKESLRKVRGKGIGMIFQDPMTSLNPYLTVGEQLTEPLFTHESVTQAEAKRRAIEALKEVGILDPENRLSQYPHHFSGGMRQRVMIAMAIILKPKLLIADEPTTALDVTVQAQILELIKKLQHEHGTAVIFVTHNLGVVAGMADRVQVMYAGRIVEQGPTREVFYQSKHPYTRALLQAIPAFHKPGEELYSIPGLPPDLSKLPSGCAFVPRCTYVKDNCRASTPTIKAVNENQFSSCLLAQEGTL